MRDGLECISGTWCHSTYAHACARDWQLHTSQTHPSIRHDKAETYYLTLSFLWGIKSDLETVREKNRKKSKYRKNWRLFDSEHSKSKEEEKNTIETETMVNLITPDDSDTKTTTTKCNLTPVYLEQLRSTSKPQGQNWIFDSFFTNLIRYITTWEDVDQL